jgi:hypothetical protein
VRRPNLVIWSNGTVELHRADEPSKWLAPCLRILRAAAAAGDYDELIADCERIPYGDGTGEAGIRHINTLVVEAHLEAWHQWKQTANPQAVEIAVALGDDWSGWLPDLVECAELLAERSR